MVAITSPSTNGSQEECDPLILSQEEQESQKGIPHMRKSSRKQWSVQGEPRSLLKRLRSRLAEDGCPESQFLMAKALLEHTQDLNYEENCHQAIFWLTQASLQGCLQASDLLEECFGKGLGMCEQNYQDVKRCLEMDHQEKLALVAGKQLFSSLAEGNEFVTQRKLETKVSEIISNKKEDLEETDIRRIRNMDNCDMKMYLQEKFGSRRLSEALMVESALEFVTGEIPSIGLNEANVIEQNQTFWSKFINFHTFIFNIIEWSFYRKFSLLFSFARTFFFLLFTFLSFVVYFFSWSKIAVISLVMLWLVCFFTMSYSAMSVMIRYRNKNIFSLWARVFQHFNQELNLNIATIKYKHKFIQYYITYFGCLLVYLILFPIVNKGVKALITPPLVLISCCMLTSLFQSNFCYNCLSSFLYIFAHYSEGQKHLKDWFIQTLPPLGPYIIQESFNMHDILYLNLDIGSIFHSLWFVSLAFVSLTLGVSGILFHTLCITWFHMTLVASSEQFGCWIYFSVVVWSFICLIPQGLNLLTIFTPALLSALCFFTTGLSLWLTFLVFVIVGIFLCILSCFDSKLASLLKSVFLILSIVFLFQQQTETSSKISSLKWEQFQNICLPTKEAIGVHTVLDCRPLRGTVVHWQATVKQIEIDSISNLPDTVSSLFPAIIQPQLKCSFGVPPPPCDRELFNSDADHQRCLLFRDAKGTECSLEQWNEYRFRFIVLMETNFWKFSESSEVILVAGNEFQNAAFNLSVHDRISFIGTLDDGLGTSQPKITLNSLNCIDCKVKNFSVSNTYEIAIDYEMLSKSLRSTFNFFFGPTITM